MLALALLTSGPLAAQQGTVPLVITVRDRDSQQPLAGALVLVGDSAVLRGTTSSSGRWEGAAVPGIYRLRIRMAGYAAYDGGVVVKEGGTTWEVSLLPALVPLDAVVVTAARREQKLADAVVETVLLGGVEMARSGSTDLASALAEQAGIQVDGGVPAGAGIQLRGYDSRRVLVLVDGLPLVGRVNGNLDLSRLPLAAVERVEIVRGPQSTLYGSDALGGVINVVTRLGRGRRAGLGITLGTQGRREAAGEWGWNRGGLALGTNAGVRSLDLVPGLAGDLATFARRADGLVRGRWEGQALALDLSALGVGERQRYRIGQLYQFSDNLQIAARLAGTRRIGLARLGVSYGASGFDHLSRRSTLAAPASDSGAMDRQRLQQLELTWAAVLEKILVDAGLSWRSEQIAAERLAQHRYSLATVEPFVQLTLQRGPLSVVPGLRLSWSERWGQFNAPRLAVLLRPAERWALRAGWGLGYRAPDFKELYLAFVNQAAGYAVVGNPELRPERSQSLSLGVEYSGDRLYLRLTGFASAYRDFIETTEPDANGTYSYANVARGRNDGLEVEASAALGRLRLDGGAEFLHSRDLVAGTPLLGRPSYSGRLAAALPPFNGVRARLALLYTGRTPLARQGGEVTRWRGSFPRLDLQLNREVTGRVSLGAFLSNLLDRRMGESWPGFSGRQFGLQLRWQQEGRRP
jgi:outer membrane receptor for ferrienterochelin and colicins